MYVLRGLGETALFLDESEEEQLMKCALFAELYMPECPEREWIKNQFWPTVLRRSPDVK